ncbi:MAG TPA: FtsX-like permease family protein [Steroidobacteraceae bacterium]|nr:FtsX-like permease family protein [Steroidobacteraceae bacterium]
MLLQILVAFVLFGVLQGVKSGVDQAILAIRAQLYWVRPADAGTSLPFGLEQRIAAMPGVKHIYPADIVGASYQRPNQQVAFLATNFDAGWAGNLDVGASPAAISALAHTRTGALVSAPLQAQYHWKVGDQIPLLTRIPQQDGSKTWTFRVVGTYRPPDSGVLDRDIIVRDDYYQEARQADRDTVSQYIIEVADVAQGEQIARRIDALSTNSPSPTRTESTRAINQSRYQNLGDLNFVVHSIVGAALFALLIASAALTMQSVRQRTKELAVLKTMGFSERKVFVLLLLESIALSLGAALVGLVVASRLMPWANRFLGLRLTMPHAVMAVGLMLALVLALASASWPAWRVLRLQVAEALAGR